MKHPTISLWQRQDDGSYAAEIRGYELRVRWTPAGGHHRRGFLWQIATPTGERLIALEPHEEMEVAMGEAEDQLPPAPA